MNLGMQFDRAICAHGPTIAIIDENRQLTYAELGERATRLANSLVGSGMAKGQRVALLLPNCLEAVITDGAIMKTGLIKVALNARVSAGELASMLRDSGASLLVTHGSFAGVVSEVLSHDINLRVIVAEMPIGRPDGWQAFDDVVNAGENLAPDVEVDIDDLYKLQYTSGTSGVLKAAMLTHRNWLTLTRAMLMRRGTTVSTPRVSGYVAPITHAAGGAVLSSLLTGGRNVLLRKFEPADFLRQVEVHRITDVLLVPAMINMLLECPELATTDISSLESIVYGTAPMAPERIRQALAAFGPVLAQGYGQTESCGLLSLLSPEDHLAVNDPALEYRLLAAGRPAFDVELRIIDDEGREVPTGEIGEISIRGDCVMRGYWNAPELTAETIVDGWLRTRDMGRVDEDGYLYLVDRKSDMIISGGFNVYPAEVENALIAHPAVFETAVVSVPDDKWGETVKAVVVLKQGAAASEAELIAHCRENLAHFKAPRTVDFVDELPKSPVGKILRRVVREKYWAGMDRRIS